MMKKVQSAENHTAITPLQHFIWLPLGMIMILAVITYIIAAIVQDNFSILHILLLGMLILAIIPGMLARKYALILQNRLIRTEERLRYYMLAGKNIDSRITMEQLIALRFASDGEYVALVEKTLEENLSKDEIKKAIKNWRADYYRV
ncbi:DUF6526 family protein [Bacillus sp. B15-48]|uniref:DUF6526 family protein n=1 Tax=Bacillus sp. B15-48 TaxID=1548601 RepID=UPI001EF225DF|nr:DUF6526 family protein [Bacillus sp. B15-48]